MAVSRGPALALALVAALWSAAAVARPAPAPTAKQHAARAESYYRVSNYPAALAEYRAAHRLEPRPIFLFNIARCYEVMARLDDAISYYELYLETEVAPRDRKLVEDRLANLKLRRAQERRRDRERRRSGQSSGSTAAWVTLGIGTGALVTGAVFGALARGKADEFTAAAAAGRTYTALDEIDRKGRAYQGAQIGLLIAGGVATAAAGGYLILRATRPRRERSYLMPVASGTYLGLVSGGTY